MNSNRQDCRLQKKPCLCINAKKKQAAPSSDTSITGSKKRPDHHQSRGHFVGFLDDSTERDLEN